LKLILICLLLITSPLKAGTTVGITNPDSIIPLQTIGLPAVNTVFTDPAFNNTPIRRITNYMENGGWGAHTYSQLQAFSPDNSHILLIENGSYIVKNRVNLTTTLMLDSITIAGNFDVNAPRWHPSLNNTIVAYDSNADTTIRVAHINAITGEVSIVYTFPSIYSRIRSNQSFDELSHDGRWITGMAATSDGDQMLFSLDLFNNTLGAQLRLSDLYNQNGGGTQFEPDWIGASPLGNYLVVQWVPSNPNVRLNGMEIFNIQTGTFIQQINPNHAHGDLGLDANGNEVFVSSILASPEDNNLPAIVSYDLPLAINDPALIRTVPWETVWHISCQGPRGSCVVTSGNTGMNFDNEVFILNLDGSIKRLTHHRSSNCGYWVQPRASVSKNGQYVVFDSDYFADAGINSCNTQGGLGGGDVFMIELIENLIFTNGFETIP
jgi:hypothetical protein